MKWRVGMVGACISLMGGCGHLASSHLQMEPTESVARAMGAKPLKGDFINGRLKPRISADGLKPLVEYDVSVYRLGADAGGLIYQKSMRMHADRDGTLGLWQLDSKLVMDHLISLWQKTPGADLQPIHTNQSALKRELGKWKSVLETHAEYLLFRTMAAVPLVEVGDPLVQKISAVLASQGPSSSRDVLVVALHEVGSTIPIYFYGHFETVPRNVRKIDFVKNETRIDFEGRNYPLDGYALVPNGVGPFPTVIMVAGSGGSLPYGWANVLASYGVAVVAVRYFSYEAKDPAVQRGAVNHLIINLPLERFAAPIQWAREQDFVRQDEIYFLGESRGGEAALLVAQHFGNQLGLNGVMALRPMHMSVGAKANNAFYRSPVDRASWTRKGQEVPYLRMKDGQLQMPRGIELLKKSGSIRWMKIDGIEVPFGRLVPMFEEILASPENKMIPPIAVNEFRGRILALAGGDDGLWPAAQAVQHVQKRRQIAHSKDHYVVIPGAGHYVNPQRASTYGTDEPYFLLGDKNLKESVPLNQVMMAVDGGHPVPNAIGDLIHVTTVLDFIQAGFSR